MINPIRLSKTMAHALRHDPKQYNLALSAEGWVSVELLLAGLQGKRGLKSVSLADVERVVARPGKKRFQLQNGQIRAYYGHSVETKVDKTPAVPPEILYHGTTPTAADQIAREGLKPMRRQYVHLSADIPTATEVARRRTPTPIILIVNALQAHQAGIPFYLGNQSVWLSEPIPPRFISHTHE